SHGRARRDGRPTARHAGDKRSGLAGDPGGEDGALARLTVGSPGCAPRGYAREGIMIRHHVLMGTLLGGALALAAAAGCGRIAVGAAPEKTASAERTPAALEADKIFWSTLHGGAYDRIPEALTALKAAYLANPNDPV